MDLKWKLTLIFCKKKKKKMPTRTDPLCETLGRQRQTNIILSMALVIQGPVYEAVGLKDKLGFGSHRIILSSACVETQIHTEIHKSVCTH